jgi:hypothetical protein
VQSELPQQVLDVRAGSVRADRKRLGDGSVIGTSCEHGENLSFPSGELRQEEDRLIPFSTVPYEFVQERREEPGRNECLAANDRLGGIDEI